MSDLPPLSVLVITYNRRQTVLETLRRLEEFLRYDGERHLIVADDGSEDETPEAIAAMCPQATIVKSPRVGLGANNNAGLAEAFSRANFVFQLQDDMHLETNLNLTPHVLRLMNDPTIGFITFWHVAFHHFTATCPDEYWHVDWNSRGPYVANDHPHLKHKRFHDFFGSYPEGLRSDYTEEKWCGYTHKQGQARPDAPKVLIPIGWDIEHGFSHVGAHTSWKYQGL